MWTSIVAAHPQGRAARLPSCGERVRLTGGDPPVEGGLLSVVGYKDPRTGAFVFVELAVMPADGVRAVRVYPVDPDALSGVFVWVDGGAN